MKTAKEITIDYLKSIEKDRENALAKSSLLSEEGANLLVDLDILDNAIKIVEKIEGVE